MNIPFPQSGPLLAQPAISIIIPVYNASQSVQACIDSLVQQHGINIECIFVDDASTDDTAAICQAASARHASIRYHHLPHNGGQGLARNAGLSLAQGDYILFVDADDNLAPQAFCQLYAAAKNTDADIVVYGYSVHADSTVRTYIPAQNYSPRELMQDKHFFHAAGFKLFKSAFIQHHGLCFPPSRSAEDAAFVFKALVCQPRIASCCQALYNYNFHVGNTSHQLARRTDTFISLLDMQDFLYQHSLYADYAPQFRKVVVDCALRHPMHLFLIASLWRGKNRASNLRAFPQFMLQLLLFFYKLYTR